MSFIFGLFSAAASAVSLYSLLCIVRIFFTWLPDLNYSPFGKLLAAVCDPWLNIFRKFNPFKRSALDISPMFAIGALMLISSVLKQIAFRRSFSPWMLFAVVISILWSICSSILTFFNVLLAIRLIAELLNRTQNSIWYTMDSVLNPIIYKVSGFFLRNRFVRPKTAMIITLGCSVLLQFALGMLVSRII
ncbi:YggT family protein [Treponema sp. HNW]|uniref:YggT family protein n=1 Tax=Treponema sp. HNW TaxID=3116654 RepID=UPI003D0D761D